MSAPYQALTSQLKYPLRPLQIPPPDAVQILTAAGGGISKGPLRGILNEYSYGSHTCWWF